MESGLIQNFQITADAHKDNKHLPIFGRANKILGVNIGGKGCWKASAGNYLEVSKIYFFGRRRLCLKFIVCVEISV